MSVVADGLSVSIKAHLSRGVWETLYIQVRDLVHIHLYWKGSGVTTMQFMLGLIFIFMGSFFFFFSLPDFPFA